MGNSVVKQKSFEFAIEIIELYKQLQREGEYVISRQLLRSGTSIGANIEEATASQSRRDFHAKMVIASKEARETKYWLKLLQESNLTPIDISPLLLHIEELIRLLTSIVKTTSSRINSQLKTHNS